LEGTISLDEKAQPKEVRLLDKDGNTLDEPVSETIKRDLMNIWQKLRVVINPFQEVEAQEKKREIRNWDLWGPFFFCLTLALVLSTASNADEKTVLFEMVFVIVWLGGAIIAVNGQLLGGKISFFQSICLLGYCLVPLNLAATLNLFLGPYLHISIQICYVAAAFLWASYSSMHFIQEMVPSDRKELAMYPVCLFYLFLSWFILL